LASASAIGQFERLGRISQLLSLRRSFRIVEAGEETDAPRSWRDLADDLHLLGGQSGDIGLDPRDIAAWPRFAHDQAEIDGVGQCRADDGSCFCRIACRNCRIDGGSDYYGGFESNNLLRKPGKPVRKSLGVAGTKSKSRPST